MDEMKEADPVKHREKDLSPQNCIARVSIAPQ